MTGKTPKEGENKLQELMELRSRVLGELETNRKLLSEIEATIAQNFPEQSGIQTSGFPGAADSVIERVGSGIPRLDDLMNGGYPIGSNILLSGPPYSSKVMVANRYIVHSLLTGYPVVVVSLDKDLRTLHDSLEALGLDVVAFEKKGLLKYVDAYSRNIQMDSTDKNAAMIDNAGNLSLFLKTMDSLCSNLVAASGKYRLVFFSLTAWITQSADSKNFTKALQHFSQRRKMEDATTLYLIEDGIFEKSLYENMNYFMDGSIEFRSEGSTEYMRVRGLRDVRSRDWIEILNSGSNVSLGSFELKRIR